MVHLKQSSKRKLHYTFQEFAYLFTVRLKNCDTYIKTFLADNVQLSL